MSQSDEEDFHSADEGEFGEEASHGEAGANEIDKQCNLRVINNMAIESSAKREGIVNDNLTGKSVKISREDSIQSTPNDSQSNESSKGSHRHQEDEDDEDEALAERIRERNLKIARKFSAEIARNLKASAPIPVKTSKPTSDDFSEISDPLDGKSSTHPPAPPSTPALSSSFNNLSDTTAQTAGTSPSLSTQYAWRIPPRVATQQSGSGTSTPLKNANTEDQARFVLDKLSERFSQTDQNLFEKVTADIKKVSIGNEREPATTTDIPSALTSITDLGSTLGGWGWSGATKILSSASQVTSQVGSVLDSVVGVSIAGTQSSEDIKDVADSTLSTLSSKEISGDKKSTQAARDITYNDPLVDLTLNAMESLGKKAFDVMTTRDETGSLQIKGLGRPWEHLLNNKKAGEEKEPKRQHSPPPSESDLTDNCIPVQTSEPPPATLRKRRQD